MAKKQPTTKEEPSFEQAMEKLDSIVRRLEQGGESLDEALAEYAEAIKLMKLCHKKLEKVERRIEILSGVDAQGNVKSAVATWLTRAPRRIGSGR